jgi:hypothetical protein
MQANCFDARTSTCKFAPGSPNYLETDESRFPHPRNDRGPLANKGPMKPDDDRFRAFPWSFTVPELPERWQLGLGHSYQSALHGSLDQSQYDDQDHRTKGRDDDLTQQPAADGDAEDAT